jgi:hypothetical protein
LRRRARHLDERRDVSDRLAVRGERQPDDPILEN